MKNIFSIVLIVIALGGGFFAGMQYQKSQATSGTFSGGNGQLRNRFGQNGQSVRQVRGTVLSMDDTGMTIKLMDGSSKIVVVSGSTVFAKSTSAAKTDIKVGDAVGIFGSQNSDGSVTAQNVQINPTMNRGGMAPTGTK